MFCKYCGSRLDPADTVCPGCGKAVRREGGNGFWDIAGEPGRFSPGEPGPGREGPKKDGSRRGYLVLGAAACLLCGVLLLLGQHFRERTVQAYETRLAEQSARYEEEISQLEEDLSDLESQLRERLEGSDPVRITVSPADAACPAGQQDGECVFRLQAEGEAVSFQWEKQQPDGQWLALDFDALETDSRYGLQRREDLAQGLSELLAAGLTEESAGCYRCTAVTTAGSVSLRAELTVLPETAEGSQGV